MSTGHDTLRIVVVLAVVSVGALAVLLADQDAARRARRPLWGAVALLLVVVSATGVVRTVEGHDGFATALYAALLAPVVLATLRVATVRR